MSKRKWNVLLSALSLLFGGAIYLLIRKDSIVSVFVQNYIALPEINFAPAFLRHYWGDFLWGFSLTTGLIAIFPLCHRTDCICACVACAVGGVWELAQWIGAVNGTGDVLDVAMYALAGISAIVINEIKERLL